jgi:hypothetical protein
MASVFNTDLSSALTAIQAGLRGEADPLERFGVGLSETAIKAFALEQGMIGAGEEMDANAKTTARLALLFQHTDRLAGDFVNTSDSLANQMRILKAGGENVAATFGQRIKPLFQEFLADILPKLQKLWEENQVAILGFVEGAAEALAFIATNLVNGVIKLTTFLLENKQALLVVAGAFTAALIPAIYALVTAAAPAIAAVTALAAAGGLLVFFGTTIADNVKKLTGSFVEATGASKKLDKDIQKASNSVTSDVVKMSNDSQRALLEMQINGGHFTDELRDTIINNANSMTEIYVKAVDEMVTSSIKKYGDLAAAGVITQETFDTITGQVKDNAEELKTQNEAMAGEIVSIAGKIQEVQTALAALPDTTLPISFEVDQEALKKAEEQLGQSISPADFIAQQRADLQTQLDQLTTQLTTGTQTQRDEVVRITAESVSQLRAIQEIMKRDASAISAEQASVIAQNAIKEANDVISAAETKYQETVGFALKEAEVGNITTAQADEVIAAAQRQRDDTIAAAKTQTTEIVKNAKSLVEQQGYIFDTHTAEAITKWQAFWRFMGKTVVDFGKSMVKAVVFVFKDLLFKLVDGLLKLAGAFGSWAAKELAAFGKFFSDLGAQFGAWLRDVAIPWAKDFVTKIPEELGNLKDKMLQIGRDTLQGFVDGVKEKYQNAVDSVTNFGKGIIDSIKGTLGIQSPSRVFREFGGFTAEGFLLGFEEKSPDAIAAMGKFVTGLNKETAKLSKKDLDFTGALEDLAATVDDSFQAAADAVRTFASENADAMKTIKDDIKSADDAIRDLKESFNAESATAEQSFVSEAAAVVVKAQEDLITLKQELTDLLATQPQGEEATTDSVAKFQAEKAALEKSIAEKNALIASSSTLEVNLDAEIQRQKDFNALNELQQLQVKFDQEKLARETAFQEELVGLENQKLALETSLAEREQQWVDFTANLAAIDADFTTIYQEELVKREDLTRTSVDNMIAIYERLKQAALAAKAAGANISGVGGFAEGGFTGSGHDSDVAGVVHKNEFVAPSWLVKAKPDLFSALESMRVGGGAAAASNQQNYTFNVQNNGRESADFYANHARMRWLTRYAS